MLSTMRFKGFIWPHNPRSFHVLWQRRVAVLDAPGGRFHVQELGRTCRILRGQGEFSGSDAYATFLKLAAVFDSDGPGTLVHPLWHTKRVYFTRLELTQEPRQDYVAYAFEFTETGVDGQSQAETEPERGQYLVAAGDTLWSIAQQNGTSVQSLLTRNPDISNPNTLQVGQKVHLK